MRYAKTGRIVLKLSEMTHAGKVEWEETENEGIYMVAFRDYAVRIWRAGADYFIGIYNAEGVKIEEVSDVALSDDVSDAYTKMGDLYEAARRRAMGVEDALDGILDSLDEAGGEF